MIISKNQKKKFSAFIIVFFLKFSTLYSNCINRADIDRLFISMS